MDIIFSSPTKNNTYHDIKKITLPSLSGQIQILPKHAETFLLLKKGNVIFADLKNVQSEIAVGDNSQCYIQNNIITIFL